MGADSVAASFGVFSIFIVLFLFVLAILWLLMPFAVFSIKDKVKEMEKRSDALQRQMREVDATLENIEKGIKVLVEQGKLKIAQEKRIAE